MIRKYIHLWTSFNLLLAIATLAETMETTDGTLRFVECQLRNSGMEITVGKG